MRALAISLALIIAGPVHALSCMRPDAVRLLEKARKAEEIFYIVKGQVTFLEAVKLPKQNSEVPAVTRARVTGTGLSATKFPAASLPV